MGTAAPKKRPMRSRRSGVKTLSLVKANLSILKKLAALFILVLLFACETPYKVIETSTIDSTGKEIKVKTKYYQQTNGYSVTPPVLYGGVVYPYIAPRIIVPVGPRYYSYRGGRRR